MDFGRKSYVKNYFDKKLSASMTVEAAFLVPIVIFVLFALLYLTFELHDRVRLESVMERALLKGNFRGIYEEGVSYKEEENRIYEYLECELEEKFFVFQFKEAVCKVDSFVVEIKIVMEKRLSLNPVKRFLGEETQVILERKRILHKPEESVRIYEGLRLFVEHGEDGEFVEKYAENNEAAFQGE